MNAPATASANRSLVWAGRGIPTQDGAGVKLTRIIGQQSLPGLDPFLLFDAFGSDDPDAYIAGFPDHPHRGFETVTYMLEGRMRHRDSKGNEGLLTAGSVQWMTAGAGLVHSEMPEQEEGRMAGFQLWVNLPAKDKMTAPRYQDVAPELLPVFEPAPGVSVKLICGHWGEVASPVEAGVTDPFYADLALAPGAAAEAPVPEGHNAFVYVYEGSAQIGEGGELLPESAIGVLGEGGAVRVTGGDSGAKVLVIAGRPLREPVARYGPFVMNTEAEIHQAFADFRAGRF